MAQQLLLACMLLAAGAVHGAMAQQPTVVDTADAWLAAMATPSVQIIRVTADLVFNPSQGVPGAGPSGVYLLTRNITIMGPDSATSWFPTLDYTLVYTPKVRIPRGVRLVMRHITLGHLGPQGSLSSGAIGYDLPFYDNSSSGLVVYSECYLVLVACAPLDLTNQVLATLPRPYSMPGVQQSALLPDGTCVPPNPARVLSGKCFSASFKLVNAAWQKDVIGTALYSPMDGDVISAYFNVTVLCDQVFSLECLQTEGLFNCTKKLAENSGVPPPAGGSYPHPPALVGPSPKGVSGVIIGVSVGAAVGGVLLVLLVAAAVYAVRRSRHPRPCFVTEPKILVTIGTAEEDALAATTSPDSSWEARCKSHGEEPKDEETTSSSSLGASPSLGLPPMAAAVEEAAQAAAALSPTAEGERPTEGSQGQAGPRPPLAFSTPDVVSQLNQISHDLETTISDNQLMIKEVIGTGAYGTVYRGTWKGLPVAVKSLLFTSDAPGPNGGVTKKDRILMEAALSKSISHPNVVTSYSCDLKPIMVDRDLVAGSSGLMVSAEAHVLNHWRIYIIQELCDGGSLRRAVELHSLATKIGSIPEIPLGTVLELACGLACGMSHLHERNVIHGDLNPANVLLKWLSPGRLIPKVCDFGLSVHLTGDKSHVSNSSRGTPFYIAPEVAQHGNLGRAADVYAMGVILWELYMGKVVWTVSHTGHIVQRSTFPWMPRGTPLKYQSLVAACLEADPARRPTFAVVLERLVDMHRDLSMANFQPAVDLSHAAAAAPAPLPTSAAPPAAPAPGAPGVVPPGAHDGVPPSVRGAGELATASDVRAPAACPSGSVAEAAGDDGRTESEVLSSSEEEEEEVQSEALALDAAAGRGAHGCEQHLQASSFDGAAAPSSQRRASDHVDAVSAG